MKPSKDSARAYAWRKYGVRRARPRNPLPKIRAQAFLEGVAWARKQNVTQV